MSILSGRYQPDQGTIRLRGKPVRFKSPADALSKGIGMVYQRFMLVESLSVAENIILGTTGKQLRLDLAQASRKIEALSLRYGLAVDPHKYIWQLSMGERQRVEILKLLFRQSDILIFDEPTAILSPPEIKRFFAVLKKLIEAQYSILFISHKLEEVLELSDWITIMRRGKVIADMPPTPVLSKRELARLMVGREVVLKIDRKPCERGETILAVRGLAGSPAKDRTAFRDIDFSVRRGEVFAITGVAGNGQEDLIAALTARHPFARGRIIFEGQTFSATTWLKGDKKNIVYIPEDRHQTGSLPDISLEKNFILTRLREFCRGPFLDLKKARQSAMDAIENYHINAPAGPSMPVRQLSGGNLQKLILARELGRQPKLIIAEHPSQGLDIKATEDVWQALLAQRFQAAILLVSGDLKEVLSLADRVAVMFRGRILEIISTRDPERVAEIGLLMAGAEKEALTKRA
jgi:simple sugar transport system ATP-binding protein